MPRPLPTAVLVGLLTSLPATGTPAASLASAVHDAPALHAARERAQSARARLAAAGRLPNPELEAAYSQARAPSDGQYPMWEISLRQPLPKAGERTAEKARASAQISLAETDYAVIAAGTAADTALALAEADAAQARLQLWETQISRTESIIAVFDARLASGSGRIADRLALQTRVASLRLLIEQESRTADDAQSAARALLGLQPSATLPAYSAPTASEINPEAPVALALAAARGGEAAALARIARASARPMTSVAVRFEREEQSMGNMDTVGVAFTTELPFHSRGAARAETSAALAEERAARAEGEAARHQARSALARVERAERLAASTRRLADETLARIDAEYDSLVRSVGAVSGPDGGAPAVILVLELLERQTDAQLQVIEAGLAARVARAELWRHVPFSVLQTP